MELPFGADKMTFLYRQVQIQEKGRLTVEGGNGQQPAGDIYELGGGAGGIIQIIAPEGSLAANTSSMKHGDMSSHHADCSAEDGHFLLKGKCGYHKNRSA